MDTLKRLMLGGLLAVGLPVLLVACGDDDDDNLGDNVDDASTSVLGQATDVAGDVDDDANGDDDVATFDLNEQNDSGFDGEVALTADGNSTRVDVTLTGDGVDDEARPMHIHDGSCDDLSTDVAYPLDPVEDGRSTTTVDVSLAYLKDGDYAINVHRSEAEMDDYVACGDIPD